MIAISINNKGTLVFDAINQTLLSTIPNSGKIFKITFSPDSKYLAQALLDDKKVLISYYCPKGTYY